MAANFACTRYLQSRFVGMMISALKQQSLREQMFERHGDGLAQLEALGGVACGAHDVQGVSGPRR